MPFDLTAAQALWMAVGLFGAAYVRGYSGFGFAALVVSAASLVTDPLHFVPVVILADFLLTATQARQIRGDIDWRRVGTLFGGCLVGVPLGVWAMSGIGIDSARAVISVFILVMCAILLAGWNMARPAKDAAHVGVGFLSGLANGAAIGGLPVAAFFSAQPIRAAAFRATLIAYFTALDLWTIPNMARSGLITRDTFLATGMAMPVLILGLWLGSRHFLRSEPQNFRRFAIILLATLAGLGLLKALQ
jgi:uncharacterized membrane protein YfcA